MDHSTSFAISAAGMSVERTRVEVAALNLANAHTVHTAGGTNFRPLQVVARAGTAAIDPFAARVDSLTAAFADEASGSIGLPVATVHPSNGPLQVVRDPGNPFADAHGNVTYPGVDTAAEMVAMMSAMRSYEANVAAMNVTKTMALKALDIGGNA